MSMQKQNKPAPAGTPVALQYLGRSGAPFVVIALTMLLCLPALFSGYHGDDYLHHVLLNDTVPVDMPSDASLFGLFSFLDGDAARTRELMNYSLIPWWTYEGFQYAFWRPLTELTHWIDHSVLNSTPWLMHLHSLLWYALLLRVLISVFRDIQGSRVAAGLALVLYALDSTHGFTIAWIANRNAIIATVFGCLALWNYIRYNEGHWPQGRYFGPIFLLLGLLAAEFAISVTAYLFAYAVCLHRQGIRRGLLSLLPYFLISVAWWLLYKILGFGAQGSDAYYIDPAQNPLGFLAAVSERLPILLMSQLGIVPAETYNFSTSLGETLWIWSVVSLAIIGLIAYPLLKTCRVARFWSLGMMISVLPVCAAIPHDRVLLFIGVGACGLLSRLFLYYFNRQLWSKGVLKPLTSVIVISLVVMHCIVSPVLLPLMSYSPKVWSNPIRNAAFALPESALNPDKQVVLLQAPLDVSVYLFPILYTNNKPLPDRLWTLSSTSSDNVKVTREDDDTLILTTENGFVRGMDSMLRDLEQTPLEAGDRIPLKGLDIEILQIAEAGYPTQVAFHFKQSLDAQHYDVIAWRDRGFHPIALPAPGESIVLNKDSG